MKKSNKILKSGNLLIGILALLLIIQFFSIDKNNPEINPELDFITIENPPADYSQMIKTSCYDCHSNETAYPWYSNIAPVSWILKAHINEGRGHINFSEWKNLPAGKRGHLKEECAEEITENKMPLKSYTLIHKNASLNKTEREDLAAWFNQ